MDFFDFVPKNGLTCRTLQMLFFSGKTLLARAVAHHTECTFIRVSGSELVQKFIGEGSRMVRELFVMAREHAPSIIFMDEIDSIGSSRIESGSGGGDSEVQRTMLELLNQLDGFEATKNIKVHATTLYSHMTRRIILCGTKWYSDFFSNKLIKSFKMSSTHLPDCASSSEIHSMS